MLRYAMPGKGKSTKEVLKRIDYGGSLSLLTAVGSGLIFLSFKYNQLLPWSEAAVIVPAVLSIVSFISFIVIEIFLAREPVLAPFLLRQKIPLLVGLSNFLVASCNFSITYFFPMFFQTVMLTSASTAGLHLLPNAVSMSTGSLFAGWMMHRTGKYKMINLVFGSFPFIATVLISRLREDSGPIESWLSIIPLGFGNAVVLQTMLIALLAHLPESHMAVGTGFGQVFRGVGQVGGVAISSAIFQSKLNSELRQRLQDRPDADELVGLIRRSTRVIADLPDGLQRIARLSYERSLKAVFLFAACATLLAYIVRLPIPEKDLDSRPKVAHPRTPVTPQAPPSAASPAPLVQSPVAADSSSVIEEEEEEEEEDDVRSEAIAIHRRRDVRPARRLSMFEDPDAMMDLESDLVGGSARQTDGRDALMRRNTVA